MARRPRGSIVNRRHVARLEREQIQTNYITIASIAIVALVIILVISGLIYDRVIVANQPVATVNGEEITTREFQARVKYERSNLVNRYYSSVETARAFGSDPQFIGFFQNSLDQIELQLAPDLFGREIINTLIEDRIIRQVAAEMEITVTEEEIQEALEEFFGYYGGEQPPTPTEAPTSQATSTLSAQQMTLTAPTATPTVTATLTTTATTPLTPTPASTSGQAVDLTATPETEPTEEATPAADLPTPTATIPPPTPTPYTLDAFTTDYDETIQTLSRRVGFTENDLRYLLESQLLREKLLEEVTKDVAQEQDQVWARQILVEDEVTALEVISRLEAGEDFVALVAEYTTDTSTSGTGGDLGWFGVGVQDLEVEKVVFNLSIGEISTPIQTTFGWHVVQVLGHETRPLTATEYEQARQEKFEQWLTEQRQIFEPNIVLFDYWGQRIPDEPAVQRVDLQSLLAPSTEGIATVVPVP